VNPPDRSHSSVGEVASHQENVGGSRCFEDRDCALQTQILDAVASTGASYREEGDSRSYRSGPQSVPQAHSNARSRQAYTIPTTRIRMNISISTKEMTPTRRNTTAHGYMKIISMSKARNNSAIA